MTIPLVIKKAVLDTAITIGERAGNIVRVWEIRKPKVGVVITGKEIYNGKIKGAIAPVIMKKSRGSADHLWVFILRLTTSHSLWTGYGNSLRLAPTC